MRRISEKIQISAVGLINAFAISQRKPHVKFKGGMGEGGGDLLAQHTQATTRYLQLLAGLRLTPQVSTFVFYGLRPIDLPRARRVLIEASSRNKKGEAKSHRGVAPPPLPPPLPAVLCCAHTEERRSVKLVKTSHRAAADASLYIVLSVTHVFCLIMHLIYCRRNHL